MLSTKPLDIRPDHAEIVYKILKDNLEEGNYVFAFGSRANWTAKQSSDLDLAMDGFGMKLDKKIKSNLEDAFEESDLPYKVDVVDLNSVSESFREAIQDQLVRVLWDWRTYKLGEIVTLNYGKALTASKRILGTIPVYSSGGLTGWHNQPLITSECIVVGRKGTVGSVYYVNQPSFCIDTVFYILPNQEYDLKYLFYKLLSMNLSNLSSDSAVPGLNRDNAYGQRLLLPPLPEQKRIAEILSSLDNKIEINKQINKTLEEMAEALFKSWFIDFDPVRVKKAALEAGADEEGANLAVMKFISSKTDEELGNWGML